MRICMSFSTAQRITMAAAARIVSSMPNARNKLGRIVVQSSGQDGQFANAGRFGYEMAHPILENTASKGSERRRMAHGQTDKRTGRTKAAFTHTFSS